MLQRLVSGDVVDSFFKVQCPMCDLACHDLQGGAMLILMHPSYVMAGRHLEVSAGGVGYRVQWGPC